MRILVIGRGVIGTTYGYLFERAGHEVEHLLRKNSIGDNAVSTEIKVELLDGRADERGVERHDKYVLKQCTDRGEYDLIFVSVPSGGVASVMESLRSRGISGNVLLACGFWEDRTLLDEVMRGRRYILGYPVAGGSMRDGKLTCCVFDHFMLEKKSKSTVDNYQAIEQLFADCSIKLERPYDMLEWIWLHMAINAGVISTIAKHGDMADTASSVERAISSVRVLKEAIRAIRETSQIIAARGVELKKYNNELLAYKIPTFISVPLMKRMFAKKVLTRKILTLHDNIDDLLYVCKCVYDSGKANGVSAPVFYDNYEAALKVAGKRYPSSI